MNTPQKIINLAEGLFVDMIEAAEKDAEQSVLEKLVNHKSTADLYKTVYNAAAKSHMTPEMDGETEYRLLSYTYDNSPEEQQEIVRYFIIRLLFAAMQNGLIKILLNDQEMTTEYYDADDLIDLSSNDETNMKASVMFVPGDYDPRPA